jgi:protein arginine kinase activator
VKCQNCPNPATVHLTNVADPRKELHLCAACAEKQQLVNPQQDLNLPAILQSLIGQHVGRETDQLARLTCPACGIKYMEFRAEGRLGCPHDYAVFRTGLAPLLQRIHRAVRHAGKAPARATRAEDHAEALGLRRQLQAAIDAERYEEAARILDLLRKKEATDESG